MNKTNTEQPIKSIFDDLVFREWPFGEKKRTQLQNGFMRCQAGRVIYETRDCTPWARIRDARERGVEVEREWQSIPIFELIGFGETMEDANAMAEKKLLRKAA